MSNISKRGGRREKSTKHWSTFWSTRNLYSHVFSAPKALLCIELLKSVRNLEPRTNGDIYRGIVTV